MSELFWPSLAEIELARGRLESIALRTPLVPLMVEGVEADVWLKLENLQPIGSFKLRGAGNRVAEIPDDEQAAGVYTASAGNMAQGVAWCARRLGIPCRVVVPDNAPEAKLEGIARLGAEAVRVPYEDWWRVMETHECEGMEGTFVHPVCDRAVMAGNGTIALELLEDLPDLETVVVPFGGGGLSSGIAAALRELEPDARVVAAEVETAAPLAASLEANRPVAIEHRPSFVDGIGGKCVLPEMWPIVSTLIDGTVVVTPAEIAEAIYLLATRNHVVAEGAGAASVAAAISGELGEGPIACVISGGNLDPDKLATILGGGLP